MLNITLNKPDRHHVTHPPPPASSRLTAPSRPFPNQAVCLSHASSPLGQLPQPKPKHHPGWVQLLQSPRASATVCLASQGQGPVQCRVGDLSERRRRSPLRQGGYMNHIRCPLSSRWLPSRSHIFDGLIWTMHLTDWSHIWEKQLL